jgi:protein-S-isoprenylcysteine O-methyltransferase Ste14
MRRVQRLRKVAILVAIVLMVTACVFIQSSWVPDDPLHEFIEWVGLLLIAYCMVGRVWSSVYISNRKGEEVVRNGPYSISRNPLYLFSIIGAVGAAAQSGSIVLALIAGGFAWVAFRLLIMREEEFLLARHGDTYRQYMAEVPRIWPRRFNVVDEPRIVVAPRIIYMTALDSIVFLISVPIFEVIEEAQRHGWVQVLLFLP